MFDSNYEKERLFWGGKPNSLLSTVLKYKKKGNVLDLGTGEGKDCIFMASLGFNVTGVDISSPGITKLNNIANEIGLNVRTIIEDIRLYDIKEMYDIITCFTVLQLFSLEEIKKMIEKMKENTSIGGLNVVSSFTKNNPNKKCPYPSKDGVYQDYYLFDNNELRDCYNDWEILYYTEYDTSYHKHGEIEDLHKHSMVSLISRKNK